MDTLDRLCNLIQAEASPQEEWYTIGEIIEYMGEVGGTYNNEAYKKTARILSHLEAKGKVVRHKLGGRVYYQLVDTVEREAPSVIGTEL